MGKSIFRLRTQTAWASAKAKACREEEARAAGHVKANELNIGDTVTLTGYGGYTDSDSFNVTIIGIDTITHNKGTVYEKSSLVFNFISRNGNAGNFCMDADEMIKLAVLAAKATVTTAAEPAATVEIKAAA